MCFSRSVCTLHGKETLLIINYVGHEGCERRLRCTRGRFFRVNAFLGRVNVHFQSPTTPILALQEIITQTLMQLLHIFAIFTKYLYAKAETKSD
jgi:hypothetical protein